MTTFEIRHTLPGPRILTWFPSATPFGLALGAGQPCADQLYAGTLGFSASGSLTRFVATHVNILTSDTSSTPRSAPSQAYGTLRYRSYEPTISVNGFSPVTFSAQDRLMSELLRFLQRMAASKPTSSLSKQSHILSHLAIIWGPQLVVRVVSLSTTDVSTRRVSADQYFLVFGV
eukprot:TRINITY_DN44_c0_g1_i1.p1 TRINITY_DN44_c0_g1~~TRINITY_DN44_c0_g1_i1.p1  ORF type:complete len:174 (-),score=3.58 TRINITY_DN44_c0_g1_i1:182-703(-)